MWLPISYVFTSSPPSIFYNPYSYLRFLYSYEAIVSEMFSSAFFHSFLRLFSCGVNCLFCCARFLLALLFFSLYLSCLSLFPPFLSLLYITNLLFYLFSIPQSSHFSSSSVFLLLFTLSFLLHLYRHSYLLVSATHRLTLIIIPFLLRQPFVSNSATFSRSSGPRMFANSSFLPYLLPSNPYSRSLCPSPTLHLYILRLLCSSSSLWSPGLAHSSLFLYLFTLSPSATLSLLFYSRSLQSPRLHLCFFLLSPLSPSLLISTVVPFLPRPLFVSFPHSLRLADITNKSNIHGSFQSPASLYCRSYLARITA